MNKSFSIVVGAVVIGVLGIGGVFLGWDKPVGDPVSDEEIRALDVKSIDIPVSDFDVVKGEETFTVTGNLETIEDGEVVLKPFEMTFMPTSYTNCRAKGLSVEKCHEAVAESILLEVGRLQETERTRLRVKQNELQPDRWNEFDDSLFEVPK